MSTPTPRHDDAEQEPDRWIGRVIDDRYRIEEHLGEGGMGAVFIAEHLKLHKQVALKVIHPHFAGDGEVAARFAREAMASAQLEHPNIASALDYGSLPEGGAYLVMQLVRGKSLHDLLSAETELDWPMACEVLAQVADALTAAHARGIVHRDLKPENILLQPRDDGSPLVKVLDFGIARIAMEGQRTPAGAEPTKALTRVGTIIGTPGYMAPEQAMGDALDHRADLYALGVILWEALSGRPLFQSDDLAQIVTRQLTEEPPPLPPSTKRGPIPAELSALVTRLLERKPKDRPESAAEVRTTLRRFQAMAAAQSLSEHAPLPSANAAAPSRGTERGVGTAPTQHAKPAAPLAETQHSVVGSPAARRSGPADLVPRLPIIVGGAAVLLVMIVGLVLGVTALGGTEEAGEEGKTLGLTLDMILPDPISPGPPAEVQEHIDTMMQGDRRALRRESARWLDAHEPQEEVPEWALAVAALETARGCRAKKRALARVVESGEEAVLPALRRMDRTATSGCGFLNLTDCYGCLRRDLARALRELAPEDAEPDSADPEGAR